MSESRVLLVTPRYSYRIPAYLQAAQSLGMEVTVASDGAHSLIGALQQGIHVDFRDPLAARQRILAHTPSPHGVIATDDSVVELAADVARALRLPGNPCGAGLFARRKDHARQRLQARGVPVPAHQSMALSDIAAGALPEIAFPLVVKPLAMSASRGVIRADDGAALRLACARISRIVATAPHPEERQRVLIEHYLPGLEIALEGILHRGRLHVVAVFDKPEPLTGPFFEETYYLTPSRLDDERLRMLCDEVARCCRAYGLEQGPVHAEARLTSGGPVLLEPAARTIGGQCGQLIEFSLRQKLEETVIRGMCGLPLQGSTRADAAGVLMIPITEAGILQRVEGLTDALQTEFVEDIEIHIRPGYELRPLPEGASYLGFVFAQGPDFEATYGALKKAYSRLKFVTRPKWELESLAG